MEFVEGTVKLNLKLEHHTSYFIFHTSYSHIFAHGFHGTDHSPIAQPTDGLLLLTSDVTDITDVTDVDSPNIIRKYLAHPERSWRAFGASC